MTEQDARSSPFSFMRSSLRFLFSRLARAPVALCAGFSGLVLVLCVLAGLHFKMGVKEEFYRETQNVAQVLMAGFDDEAAAADGILSRLAAEIPQDALTHEHETDLHRLLASYALQPAMLGPAVVDRNGTLIASAMTDDAPGLSLKDRNVFRAHAKTPRESKLYIGAPTRNQINDEWAI
jgi:hypothetical protein